MAAGAAGGTMGALAFPVALPSLPVSARGPSTDGYRPIESTSSVSLLASARSARRAESAARSSGVFDLLPVSHAPATKRINPRQIVLCALKLCITLDENGWWMPTAIVLPTRRVQGIQSQ